jgi:hypothetical protein
VERQAGKQAGRMTPVDVNETVAFHRGWLRLKYLAIGAGLIAIAILDFGAILRRESLYGTHDLGTILAAFVAAALGVLMLLREVYRYVVPGEPLLILTPKAITINIDGLTCIDIPWAEVLDLATVDIKTRAAPPINVDVGGGIENEVRDTCRNVTAVAVAQDFYDSAISPAYKAMKQNKGLKTVLGLVDGMVHHIDARTGSGSGWSSTFMRRGDQMLVALHHSMLQVSGKDLRAAVEERWRAFGGSKPGQ